MKKEEESSLELLLDTMCNTFGGVMFIAISLVVIISVTSATRKDDEPSANVEELATKIQILKQQLDAAAQEQVNLQQQDAAFSNDPRLKQLAELAALEAAVAKQQMQVDIASQARNAAVLLLQQAQQKLSETQANSQNLGQKIQDAKLTASELDNVIAALKTEKSTTQLKMVFTTLEGKDEMPYFIALVHGKAWRIGPDDKDNLLQPNGDVSSRKTMSAKGEPIVVCTPKSNAGIPICDGDNISSQLRQFLKSIPRGRVPRFMVTKSSAKDFYVLREKLKHSGIFHGFSLNVSETEFSYSIIDDGSFKYEY